MTRGDIVQALGALSEEYADSYEAVEDLPSLARHPGTTPEEWAEQAAQAIARLRCVEEQIDTFASCLNDDSWPEETEL